MIGIVIRRLVLPVMLLTTVLAANAAAQGFISPFIGSAVNKPALAVCSFSGCEDGKTTFGVGLGTLGSVLGFEFDIGYTKGFFGETTDDQSSGLLTLMGNVMLAPRFGFVQPYGLIGLGVMKMNVDFTASAFLETSETKMGWDLGGGVILLFGRHVGVRGDVRHIRSLQGFDFLITSSNDVDVDFNRASAGLVLRF